MKKIKIIITTLLLSFCVVFCAGCSQNLQITGTDFPNTIAEKAPVADQYVDIANEMTKFAIDEFNNNISKIPRPSGDVENIRNYLVLWGKQHNLDTTLDPVGNVYYDIPAAKDCEDYPNIILQAHMDMVATSKDKDIDLHKDIVDVEYDKDKGEIHSRDYKTNIGADDAEGMTSLMALAVNPNFYHGKLRMLFTYDEETTQQGAKSVSVDELNADYLINIDCGPVGTIIVSSAGVLKANLYKEYTEEKPNNNCQLKVSIKDLLGGHSGVDIAKERLCANVMTTEIFQKLNSQNIKYNIESVSGGNAANAIAHAADFSITLNQEDCAKAKEIINQYFKEQKNNYKDEKNATLEMSESNVAPDTKVLSETDSKQVVEVMSKIPHGMREMDKTYTDTPAISLNFATINVANGRVKITTHSRSEQDYGNDDYDANFKNIENTYGYRYEVENRYSGWPASEDQSFSNLMANAYYDTCGFYPLTLITHGGLECSRFLKIKPSLKMICIGMDVANEHAVDETWYTKSMPAYFASLINCIEQSYKLNH